MMFVGQIPFRKTIIYLGGRAFLAKERHLNTWLVVKPIPDLDERTDRG